MKDILTVWAAALITMNAAGPVMGGVLADAAGNYDWPANPATDYAEGQWKYCMLIAPETPYENLSEMTPYSWPQGGRTVYGYAQGYWAGKATAPWLYLSDATHIAALPWNSGLAPGMANDEQQVCLIWQSGASGPIKLTGGFAFIGQQQSAVSIWRYDGTVREELLSETVLTPQQPTVNYDINASVAQNDEIWFVVGTGLVPYGNEDNETLFSVTILPEPATPLLLLAGVLALSRRRRTGD